jgi:uncharacterized phage-associated protein
MKVRKEESIMVRHYIIMSSSYIDGTRIALDINDESQLNSEAIGEIISKIKLKCGDDVPLSTHFIETESDSWLSIQEYDPFFETVECVQDVEDFSYRVSKSRILSGLDVAKYILSKMKCTHLSLEKLVYFAYADYLCDYSERLFEDKIYAFTHGPVVESVYRAYKKSGYTYVKSLEEDAKSRVVTTVTEMPAKSRILFARKGAEKLYSIELTLAKYGKYSAGTLVELTHRDGSPWSQVDSSKRYQVITDDLIATSHHIECL